MITEEYKNALVEVLEIINCLEDSEKKKIPDEIIKFYEENKSTTYKPNINLDDDISNINLMNKTREIIAGLYIDYLCNDETEKQNYINQLKQIEQKVETEKREIYNPDSIFKDRTQVIQKPISEDQSMVVAKKQNIFSKILDKIKKLFKK